MRQFDELSSRDLLTIIMIQNEIMLAKLDNRASYITPADQAKLDEAWRIEKSDIRKMDDAKKP